MLLTDVVRLDSPLCSTDLPSPCTNTSVSYDQLLRMSEGNCAGYIAVLIAAHLTSVPAVLLPVGAWKHSNLSSNN